MLISCSSVYPDQSLLFDHTGLDVDMGVAGGRLLDVEGKSSEAGLNDSGGQEGAAVVVVGVAVEPWIPAKPVWVAVVCTICKYARTARGALPNTLTSISALVPLPCSPGLEDIYSKSAYTILHKLLKALDVGVERVNVVASR